MVEYNLLTDQCTAMDTAAASNGLYVFTTSSNKT